MDQEQINKSKIEGFMREYGELVKKWDVDFINYAQYVPVNRKDEEGRQYQVWETIIQTMPAPTNFNAIKSPFIPS